MLHQECSGLSVYGKACGRANWQSLSLFLEGAVEKYRDNVALTQGEREISCREIPERAGLIRGGLKQAS
jgi:hypothetical protein